MDYNESELAENGTRGEDYNYTYYYDDATRSDLQRTVRYLNIYLQPIIIIIGLLGNATSFAVFVGGGLRHLSSSVYLAALAVSDSGFLISLLISWLNYVNIDLYHFNGWCQTFNYLTFVFSFLSVWFVVSFTVERYIAICYPLKRQEMCTSKRAIVVVCTLSVLAALMYSFYLWTAEVIYFSNGSQRCWHQSKYFDLLTTFNYVDTAVTFLIPFVTILIMNIKIGYSISRFYKQTTLMRINEGSGMCGSGSTVGSKHRRRENSGATGSNTGRQQSQLKITKMLLLVSSIFLLLNLPSHAMRIHGYIQVWRNRHDQLTEEQYLTQQVFQILYYANFSVNFFLYSICGNNFRAALSKVCFSLGDALRIRGVSLCSVCRRHIDGITDTTSSANTYRLSRRERQCTDLTRMSSARQNYTSVHTHYNNGDTPDVP